MPVRALTRDEIRLARRVFGDSLLYTRVQISSLLGAGGAPFTVAVPIGGVAFFVINMGSDGYTSAISPTSLQPTFIHELTHAWQGQHSSNPFGFMVNSLLHQGMSLWRTGNRAGAYRYEVGRAWDSYNVEQQASLVEDWFFNGMQTTDPRYTYIVSNIRGQ
jgi:hypothetical protein